MTDLAVRIQQSRAMLAKFGDVGKVPLHFAQRMVQESAYWYGHPKGPARAPKHYERVTGGPHGWEIEFGANKFLVEAAILRCKAAVLSALQDAKSSNARIDCEPLREKLARADEGQLQTMSTRSTRRFGQRRKGTCYSELNPSMSETL